MAQPSRKAQFFVGPDGVVIPKAPELQYKQRLAIFLRDKQRCRQCGTDVRLGGNTITPFDTIRAGAIDHILPRSRGGQNHPENLQLLCISCNAAKGSK